MTVTRAVFLEDSVVRSDRRIGMARLQSARLPRPAYDIPVVMVHGAFAGSWIFANWLEFFVHAGWSASAISLRGHDSEDPAPAGQVLATRIADYVDDLRAVLAEVGPAVLIGHSMGGLVVQKVAEDGLAAALVLVASVAPAQLGSHDADFAIDRPVDYRDQYRELRGAYAVSDDQFEFALSHLVPESPLALNECRGRTPVDVTKIVCPVLVVGAGRDETRVFPAERLADFYAAPFVVAQQSHHDVMIDCEWVTTVAVIQSWLIDSLRPTTLPRLVQPPSGHGGRHSLNPSMGKA